MAKQGAYDLAEIVGKEMLAHEVRAVLVDVGDALEGLAKEEFSSSEIKRALRGVAEERDVDLKQMVRPLRVIFGPHEVYEAMAILGRGEAIKVVRGAVVALGDRA